MLERSDDVDACVAFSFVVLKEITWRCGLESRDTFPTGGVFQMSGYTFFMTYVRLADHHPDSLARFFVVVRDVV